MRTAPSVLKLWLKIQSQMISQTTQAIVIQGGPEPSKRPAAHWPDREPPSQPVIEAACQAVAKRRTHLGADGDKLLLGEPIWVEDQLWGAVALSLHKRSHSDVNAALKLLKWGATWLQFLLYQDLHRSSGPTDQSTDPKARPAAADPVKLIGSLLSENSAHETAITLVNQLATFLRCERVSLGLQRRNRLRLQAVSFSANFDHRTGAMQLLTDAMTEAVDQRVNMDFPPPTSDEDALTRRQHERLQQETKASHIHTFLLRRRKQVLGALVIERRAPEPLAPAQRQFIESCLPLLAEVFHLKRGAEASSWQRFKRGWAERARRWWGPRRWVGKAVTAALLAFALVLALPGNHQIHGEAVLQSIDKRILAANQDGYLASVSARPGDQVTQGDVLARLDDRDLRLERLRVAGQLQQYRQEYDNALARYERSEAAIADARVEQARAQLSLIEQQLERVELRAPMDGYVISDDISQSAGAPVSQGDVLFEIASDAGFRVMLYIDERNVSHLRTQQSGRLVLTGLPGQSFNFEVERLTPINEVRDGRNYFRVEARLADDAPLLRPGMTGSGKVLAGRQPLGWIWFHGLIDWVRLALWL